MRILIVTYPYTAPHFEWGLEIIQRHLDQGDQVTLLSCDGEMTACEHNPGHALSVCSKCVRRRRSGVRLLTGPVEETNLIRLTPSDRAELAGLPESFTNLGALKGYHVGGYDLGMAVASTVISMTRHPEFSLDEHGETVRRLLVSGMAVYRSMENHLGARPADRVYILNGRMATMRAVLRACQRRGVECHVYEQGSGPDRLHVYKNTYPHDFHYLVAEIRQAWTDAADRPDREGVAARFYRERVLGKDQSWFSFVKEQQPDLLPLDWDPSCHNVVIYNSSEDEYAAIDEEWQNPLYPSQLDGLRRLRADLDRLPANVHLYLRIHPNLKGLAHELEPLVALAGPRFTVIPPDDPVSSYALLMNASTVLTFGSTVGIEAAYWGKPSVLAGVNWYRDFGSTYNPSNHEELLDLLSRPLEPLGKEGALVYGYYMLSYGERLSHYAPEGFTRGRFRGRAVTWGRLTHAAWALVHRLPWLNRLLNAWHYSRSHRQLVGDRRPVDPGPIDPTLRASRPAHEKEDHDATTAATSLRR
jgi:hypothetical protein